MMTITIFSGHLRMLSFYFAIKNVSYTLNPLFYVRSGILIPLTKKSKHKDKS